MEEVEGAKETEVSSLVVVAGLDTSDVELTTSGSVVADVVAVELENVDTNSGIVEDMKSMDFIISPMVRGVSGTNLGASSILIIFFSSPLSIFFSSTEKTCSTGLSALSNLFLETEFFRTDGTLLELEAKLVLENVC